MSKYAGYPVVDDWLLVVLDLGLRIDPGGGAYVRGRHGGGEI